METNLCTYFDFKRWVFFREWNVRVETLWRLQINLRNPNWNLTKNWKLFHLLKDEVWTNLNVCFQKKEREEIGRIGNKKNCATKLRKHEVSTFYILCNGKNERNYRKNQKNFKIFNFTFAYLCANSTEILEHLFSFFFLLKHCIDTIYYFTMDTGRE